MKCQSAVLGDFSVTPLSSGQGFCQHCRCVTCPFHHPHCVIISCAPFFKGQLSQVGRQFYNTDIEVEILSKEETEKMTYVVRFRERRGKIILNSMHGHPSSCQEKFPLLISLSLSLSLCCSILSQVYKMNFDNAAFKHRMPQQKTAPGYEKLPMKRGIFFDMFPFSVIFRRDMTMYRIGDGLKEVFSDLQGKKVDEEFTLIRPMLEFSWENVGEGMEFPPVNKK